MKPQALPPSVARVREEYRQHKIPPRYSGPLHLATTVSITLAIALSCAAILDRVTAWEWLTVPLTFLYANFTEYAGHRGPMHRKSRMLVAVFQRHSVEHHGFFTDEAATFESPRDYKAVLFPPVLFLFFIGLFTLPVGALLYFLLSANVALLFVMTSVLYFLNYELLHFAYHADPRSRIGRLPFVQKLRQHHLLHHNRQLMTRYNFNITYPICDFLFGTLYRSNPHEH